MDNQGKGKERDRSQGNGSHEKSSTPSLLQRIGESASGLVQDSLTASGSNPHQTLSNAIDASSKGSSSRTNASRTTGETGVLSSGSPNLSGSQQGQANTLREQAVRVDQASNVNMDHWASQGLDEDVLQHAIPPSHYDVPFVVAGKEPRNLFPTGTTTQPAMVANTSASDGSAPVVDGSEVVNLLTNPSFDPQGWQEDSLMPGDEPLVISMEEQAIADRFNEVISGKIYSLRVTSTEVAN